MDQQWHYPDAAPNRTRGYSQSFQQGHEYNGQSSQFQSPTEYSQETYQAPPSASNTISMGSTPSATPIKQEYVADLDIPMEDADPYNRAKYPSRPMQSHRSSTQYLANEESTAARRYSPMNMLSPSTTQNSSPKQPSRNSYNYPTQSSSARQSPTRQANLQNFQYQDTLGQFITPGPRIKLIKITQHHSATRINIYRRCKPPKLLPSKFSETQ